MSLVFEKFGPRLPNFRVGATLTLGGEVVRPTLKTSRMSVYLSDTGIKRHRLLICLSFFDFASTVVYVVRTFTPTPIYLSLPLSIHIYIYIYYIYIYIYIYIYTVRCLCMFMYTSRNGERC